MSEDRDQQALDECNRSIGVAMQPLINRTQEILIEHLTSRAIKAESELAKVQAEVARLREVLELIRDECNPDDPTGDYRARLNAHATARQALEGGAT